MLENTYWNGDGRLQEQYDELNHSINFKWTKAEENTKYRYYRYYNDGDIPQGAYFASEYDLQTYFELQASIVVAKGYCRAHKGEKIPAIIRYFANKPLQGFKAWKN